MSLPAQILSSLGSTVVDVLPIAGIIFGFQFLILRRPVPNLKGVLFGFAYVVIGLSLFLVGLERALFPLGRVMAEQLTAREFIEGVALIKDRFHWLNYYWVYAFAFAIGFSTTIAEPSLIAVAIKANEVSAGTVGVWGLRIAVAIGVAIGISLGTYRIVVGDSVVAYIVAGFVVVIVQTRFAPPLIVPRAYDSGGVTTSTVTVPLVAALGLGMAENVPGRDPLIDGFGLIAFASLFPIMSVLAYSQIAAWLTKHRSAKVAGPP